MAYTNLINDIKQAIYNNGEELITGKVLQDVLVEMVNNLGSGYTYKGVATLSTNPDTTTPNIFYLLGDVGTYTNIGSIQHQSGIGIAIWNGTAWSYQNVPSDATPIKNSKADIQSGGVWEQLYGGASYSGSFNISATGEHSSTIDRINFAPPFPSGRCVFTLSAGTTGNAGSAAFLVKYVGNSTTTNIGSITIGSTLNATLKNPIESIGIYMSAGTNQHTGTMPLTIELVGTNERVDSLESDVNPLLHGLNPSTIPSNPPTNVLSYNSTTRTITIPPQTVIKVGNGYKSNSASIALPIPSGMSSAIYVIYDSSSDSYSLVPYTHTFTKTQYIIAGFRENGANSKFSTCQPWKINNFLFSIDTTENWIQLSGVPSGNSKYCNYDVSANTFTIPLDSVIKYGQTATYITTSEVVIDISPSAIAASAIIVLLDTTARTFSVIGYSETIPSGKRVFAYIRRNATNPGVACIMPWAINGHPYGIDVEGREKMRGYTKGINHRGYNSVAPENTLPAFKLSRKMGFKVVECDVRFTSDDVPVILHDVSINRTARNADGSSISSTINIADITYQQALTYDFGIYKGSAYAGTKIPTFEQLISLCRDLGLDVYIELKVGTQAQIETLVDIVEQYGMTKNVSWISFYLTQLTYVKNKDSFARLGYLATPSAQVITDTQALKTENNKVFIDSSDYAQSHITLCKNASIPLEVWTINTESAIKALDSYISGVTSDSQDASVILLNSNL